MFILSRKKKRTPSALRYIAFEERLVWFGYTGFLIILFSLDKICRVTVRLGLLEYRWGRRWGRLVPLPPFCTLSNVPLYWDTVSFESSCLLCSGAVHFIVSDYLTISNSKRMVICSSTYDGYLAVYTVLTRYKNPYHITVFRSVYFFFFFFKHTGQNIVYNVFTAWCHWNTFCIQSVRSYGYFKLYGVHCHAVYSGCLQVRRLHSAEF